MALHISYLLTFIVTEICSWFETSSLPLPVNEDNPFIPSNISHPPTLHSFIQSPSATCALYFIPPIWHSPARIVPLFFVFILVKSSFAGSVNPVRGRVFLCYKTGRVQRNRHNLATMMIIASNDDRVTRIVVKYRKVRDMHVMVPPNHIIIGFSLSLSFFLSSTEIQFNNVSIRIEHSGFVGLKPNQQQQQRHQQQQQHMINFSETCPEAVKPNKVNRVSVFSTKNKQKLNARGLTPSLFSSTPVDNNPHPTLAGMITRIEFEWEKSVIIIPQGNCITFNPF